MARPTLWPLGVLLTATAFFAGHWFGSGKIVRAESSAPGQIEVREISGGTSLLVSYPNLQRIYVYQSPFVGLPTWSCAYWFQLGAPGDPVTRQPCKP